MSNKQELLVATGDRCQARAVDVRAIAACDPGMVVRLLLDRVDSVQYSALELEDLAGRAPPSHAVRARALAEAANREASLLQRKADALRHQLQMRAVVENLVEDGGAVAELLDGVRHLIETYDLRQSGVVERRGRPRRQSAATKVEEVA